MHHLEAAHWHDAHYDYLAEMRRLNRDRLVVSAAVMCDSKLLLLRRAADDTYPGMWEFPGGGVDPGEALVDAIRREVVEEAGIELPDIPAGEVLSHPTRTALRVVVRFNLEYIPQVELSLEHDEFLFFSEEDLAPTSPRFEIFESMRDENKAVIELILKSSPR